jgi:hypothetical protein
MLGGSIPYVPTIDVTADVQYYLGAAISEEFLGHLKQMEDHSRTSKFVIRGYRI